MAAKTISTFILIKEAPFPFSDVFLRGFVPIFKYSLTGIFHFGYTVNMNSTFGALAEPNRLRIVELLRSGPLSVGEVAERLGLNQPQTSKHLRVLCDAGLVEVQASANRRIYKLRPEPFKELDDWLETYRQIWEERFDRLDDYLQELLRKGVNGEDQQ
jgi:DNA-binding transcriptional ArsR family regulator